MRRLTITPGVAGSSSAGTPQPRPRCGSKVDETHMPSSAIRRYAYDERCRELTVGYVGGGDYVYVGVPPEVFAALQAAPSKGVYVNTMIKPRFAFRTADSSPKRSIRA